MEVLELTENFKTLGFGEVAWQRKCRPDWIMISEFRLCDSKDFLCRTQGRRGNWRGLGAWGNGAGRDWKAQWFGVRPGWPLGHPTLLYLFLVGPGLSFSPISEALPNSMLPTPFLEYCQTSFIIVLKGPSTALSLQTSWPLLMAVLYTLISSVFLVIFIELTALLDGGPISLRDCDIRADSVHSC